MLHVLFKVAISRSASQEHRGDRCRHPKAKGRRLHPDAPIRTVLIQSVKFERLRSEGLIERGSRGQWRWSGDREGIWAQGTVRPI